MSLWQGGVGIRCGRAAGLAGHGGSSVVVPPAYVPPVINVRRKAVTGEIILAEAPALRAPETSV